MCHEAGGASSGGAGGAGPPGTCLTQTIQLVCNHMSILYMYIYSSIHNFKYTIISSCSQLYKGKDYDFKGCLHGASIVQASSKFQCTWVN